MSDVISFKYSGDKDAYNKFKAGKMSEGITMEEAFSKYINQELIMDCAREANLNQTASKHENDLRDRLLNEDLSHVMVKGSYHVNIDDTELIQATTHDLAKRVKNAVHSAIATYSVNKWATSKVDNMSEDVLSRENITT